MNILQRLNSITNLPTLPEVALKVQEIVFSDDGCAMRLAKIIEQDPSLSAKILQVANSGFYGALTRIASVPTAITRLGFNEIGHIVIATSVIKNFSRMSNILDYKQFWRHALTAAHMAFTTSKISGVAFTKEERETLYLSGLLHDIGILIYDQFFHNEFQEIMDYAVKNEVSYLEAEAAVAPKETHATLGAALLEIWKLSPPAINGVRFHHAPERASDKQKSIPYAMYLAEYILCNSGLGSFEGLITRQSGSILAELKIDTERLPEFLMEAQHEVDRSDLMLAIESTGKSHDRNQLLRTV
ncbi:MAG: HDOD domain-containing protein [Chitinispirillales bacterium]|jgi:HD-like signal output (HDOD) protein|nr:HDOD domain-containing protein [Chitinispirillales bacterium]